MSGYRRFALAFSMSGGSRAQAYSDPSKVSSVSMTPAPLPSPPSSRFLARETVPGPRRLGDATCAKTDGAGACECPSNCKSVGVSCSKAVRCGGGSLQESGSCTPFWFQPMAFIEASSDCNWLLDPKYQPNFWVFNPTNRLDSNEVARKDVYQAWKAGGTQDTWLIHGCDGAGIQGDCLGDVLYLEQFGPQGAVQCSPGEYGHDHPQCGFNHPANGGNAVGFEWYNCGWQRTYENPDDADILAASMDGGLLGPGSPPQNPADLSNSGASNWALTVNHALSQCIGCSDPRGALAHTYRSADKAPNAYLTGSLSPWTCSKTGYDVYTDGNTDCYCDNEPWGGRVGSAGAVIPEPNWNTRILYCGLYKDDPNAPHGYLECDIISIVKGDWSVDGCTAGQCGGSSIKNNWNGDGQTVGAAFRLDLAGWP